MAINHPTDPTLFSLSSDFAARLLRYKIAKLWDKDTFDLYNRALFEEMKKFRDAGLPFDVLGDMTEFPPQHQFLNDVRQDLNHTAAGMGVRKCAIVASGAIVKIQIDRLSRQSPGAFPYQFFTSEAEALAWLKESPA